MLIKLENFGYVFVDLFMALSVDPDVVWNVAINKFKLVDVFTWVPFSVPIQRKMKRYLIRSF